MIPFRASGAEERIRVSSRSADWERSCLWWLCDCKKSVTYRTYILPSSFPKSCPESWGSSLVVVLFKDVWKIQFRGKFLFVVDEAAIVLSPCSGVERPPQWKSCTVMLQHFHAVKKDLFVMANKLKAARVSALRQTSIVLVASHTLSAFHSLNTFRPRLLCFTHSL